jgi:glycosyltransferase involved in cell wall biosynthesis
MRFASGVSYYTMRLANSLADRHDVSVLLLRELLPRFLFPGRKRIDRHESPLRFVPSVQVYDGIDWYMAPSLLGATRFLRDARPDVIVMPWWTSAAAHVELALILANAGSVRARLLLEFHELLDPMEQGMLAIRSYSRAVKRFIVSRADGFVTHSAAESAALLEHEPGRRQPVFVVPHGTYDNFVAAPWDGSRPNRDFTYVSFGLVRPYKGLDRLVDAFSGLPRDLALQSRLVIAGETWQDWFEPQRRAAVSAYADRITFVDRYLPDEAVGALFASADAAVYPYVRASQSGALRVALAHGLPVVASDVGGLGEACREYAGAVLVPPDDVPALTNGLEQVRKLAGMHFRDPFPWERTVTAYEAAFEAVVNGSTNRATEVAPVKGAGAGTPPSP